MLLLFLSLLHAPDRLEPAPAYDPLPQFPPPAVAIHYAQFAWAHVGWLEQRIPLEQDRREWAMHVTHAKYCAFRWDALVKARQGGRDDFVFETLSPEEWQAILHDYLGDEDYAAGRMPPPIPPWHLRPAD